ncbi:MAG: hypothetical protein J6X34_05285 [Clostridia bacterium]|nr:hypothetical protein [Clostridia bacterium]
MKKIVSLIITAILLLTFLLTACSEIGGREGSLKSTEDVSGGDIVNMTQSDSGIIVSASYRDAVTCFDDLLKATVIAEVTVSEITNPVPYTQKSEVMVNTVYSGGVSGTIYVCQMNDGRVLKKGEKYILFLGPQTDEPGNNEYYCLGGGYGSIIRVDGDNRTLYTNYDAIKGESLINWVAEKMCYKNWKVV